MPLQNRVTPLGELVADPARGLVYGNRGCLHDDERADPPPLQREALDRVPARVPRLAAKPAAAARPLHRALLPRRGDGVRRRPSPLRALPAARTTSASARSGASFTRARSARTRSTRSFTASASSPARARSSTTKRALDELPDGSFVLHDGAPHARARLAPADAGAPAGYATRMPRAERTAGDGDHAAVARRRSAEGWDERLVPLLHPRRVARLS